MLKILINAYACSPNMGSEPGMAWNWCVHLAKHCELHIITEGEFRQTIESVVPTLPQAKNMHFYYNTVSDNIRTMCWNQGDWRFYYHYKNWQLKTLGIAKEIIKNNHIDIIHQLNMIGFREPGYLWQIKDIPYIWGPVNAKESFPVSYLNGATFKNRIFIYLKNLLNYLQLKYSIRVLRAANQAKFVIGASSDASKSIEKFWKIKPITINESGSDKVLRELKPKDFSKEQISLLWVGRFIFTKQLIIALKTLSVLDNSKFKLHIVGGSISDENEYRNYLNVQKINIDCEWHGKVSHSRVQELMQQSDLFFFTSVAEGTPHVVLEAISNHLPVLCFDTCGQGDSVNEKVGVKIPLSNPQQSVKNFAEKIEYLYNNRQVLKQMSENCTARQHELSWDSKAEQMLALYEKAMEEVRSKKFD